MLHPPQTTFEPSPLRLPEELVAKGAVVRFHGVVHEPALVGHWSRLDRHHVFIFPAHGSPGDERVIEFDETVLLDTRIVGFRRDGAFVAQLAAIGAAGLEDPDDYRVAWQIWQQVGPIMSEKIAALEVRSAATLHR